jgi:hypothetical protein
MTVPSSLSGLTAASIEKKWRARARRFFCITCTLVQFKSYDIFIARLASAATPWLFSEKKQRIF